MEAFSFAFSLPSNFSFVSSPEGAMTVLVAGHSFFSLFSGYDFLSPLFAKGSVLFLMLPRRAVPPLDFFSSQMRTHFLKIRLVGFLTPTSGLSPKRLSR